MKGIVLASQSPRRKVLLGYLLDQFDVAPADIDEVAPHAFSIPRALEVIARKKALAVSKKFPDYLVLAGDTVVAYRDKLIGKAHSASEARTKLAMLSGETHEVVTGLALAYNGRAADHEQCTTKVTMDRLPTGVLNAYVDSESWVGKAGGYGIQDRLLAPYIHIDGAWSNVVGLPLKHTWALLQRNDIPCKTPPDEAWLRDHNPFDAPSE